MYLQSASEKAQEILKHHWNLEMPVNVEEIAKALGITLRKIHSPGYSGCYDIENGRPVITVNADDPDVRQRFTIAHELGHFALGHPGGFRDDPEMFSLKNYDPREIEANRFAAELLMPESIIRYLVFKERITDVIKLSLKARVSQVAMQYRLKNLGLAG